MDKNRVLKPPSTMSKFPVYTGPKFRILGNNNQSSSSSSATTTTTLSSTTKATIIQPRSGLPQKTSFNPPSNNNVTTRIPSKSFGLVKPTPVRQIVSVVTTTSNRPLSSNPSNAIKSNIQRPLTSSKLVKPQINSTTIKKTKALTFNSNSSSNNNSSNNLAHEQKIQVNSSNSNSHINTTTTTVTTTSTIPLVGEIRHLLEELLRILNSPNNSDGFSNYDTDNINIILENERLRKENSELKETISALKKSRLTSNSSVYYSPQ